MNKEVYSLLGDLGREPNKRKPEKMRKLAEYIAADGNNELKDLVHEYLAEHPELTASLMDSTEVPSEPLTPESLQLSPDDRTNLKNLLGR